MKKLHLIGERPELTPDDKQVIPDSWLIHNADKEVQMKIAKQTDFGKIEIFIEDVPRIRSPATLVYKPKRRHG